MFPNLLLRSCFSCLSAFVLSVALVAPAEATDVLKAPLQTDGLAKPNVVFGMDDSGSMDFEVLMNANDGALWWSLSAQSAWAGGVPIFYGDIKLAYLFPNGCDNNGRRTQCNGNQFAIPPTYQFASLRSSSYNSLYYDSNATYAPWSNATINNVLVTFPAASFNNAKAHPLYSPTMDLGSLQSSSASDYDFAALPGMKLPAGTIVEASTTTSGACNGGVTRTLATEVTVGSNSGNGCVANFPYYPASFWVKEACPTVNNVNCTLAPDGVTRLKLYEIKAGTPSYPSGRTYAAEKQNFANWFTYYRKRTLMLAASMGQVMDTLTGMRLGVVSFNHQASPTMYDSDSTDPLVNGNAIAGVFAANGADGATPTRETLKYIGDQFKNNSNIVQYSCQRNAAFVVTDGFANTNIITPPSYTSSTWGVGSPYQATYAGTLADISLSYYTNNIRPDLTPGRVPAAPAANTSPGADRNTNLHMNTYAISLGARGTLWPAVTNAYAQTMNWPNPSVSQSPTAIDDLWHATVNGRGSMYRATNPTDTAASVQTTLTQIMALKGAQGGAVFHSVNITAGDATGYLGSYAPQGWSGEVSARAVDAATGLLSQTATWSAMAQLNANSWTSRALFSFNGSVGVPFTTTGVGAALNQNGPYGSTTDLVAYVRGDRSKETSTYRVRTGVLGAIVNAEPTGSRAEGLVFAAANDGFMHAFDMADGSEQWAYAPSFGLGSMGDESQKNWQFQTVLDGTPVVTTVDSKTILVGGRGTAGSGFYALDVTGSKNLNETQMATRVLWEFPNASTPTPVKKQVGTSIGKPLVVKTAKYGWVVLLTSGYNSTQDGKGHVYVLDLLTGVLRYTFNTTQGSVGAGDAGLAQLSGFVENDRTVRYAYGGDEQGYLWRFDIEGSATLQLARLVDASGTALPVTAAPELATYNSRRMVFVGTGRLLGLSDFSDPRTHSFFGIWDNNTALTNVRTQLAPRTMSIAGTLRHLTGATLDWSTRRGWYFDLPVGEKAHTDPAIAYGLISFTTNKPSVTSCSSTSALYVADAASGLELPASQFFLTSFAGTTLGSLLTSRSAVTRLSDGSVAITSHLSDDSTATTRLNIPTTIVIKKTAWKEVLQ